VLVALRRNFGLKLFSFALALGGWAYFRFLAGPSIPAPFEQRLGPLARTDEKLVARSFAIGVNYVGRQNDLVVSSVEVSPHQVEVRGSEPAIGHIEAIRVPVPFPSEPSTYDAMVVPEVSGPGADPGAVTISPNLVRVQAVFVHGSGAISR
jgi:hypothetical protein